MGSAIPELDQLATWRARLARLRDTLIHVTTVADVRRAKHQKRLTQPFERNPDLVELHYRLGARVAQLTYNTQNRAGDECEEPAGFPAFVSGRRRPTVDELVRHASCTADTARVDHLSVGSDDHQGQWPFIGTAEARALRVFGRGWKATAP